MSEVTIPSIAELYALREEGRAVGYGGVHIYLRYRAVLATLADAGVAPRRLLVLGAGYGIFDRLLPPDVELVGIDVAVGEIAHAAAWAARHRPGWCYLDRPLADCGFADASFDLILLSEVIEHIAETQLPALFAEIRRVLVPGGHLLLTVPNRLQLRNRARRLIGRCPVLMDPTHLREYTLAQARQAVRGSGLAEVAFRGAVLYFPWEGRVARLLPPESPWRSRVVRLAPQLASHFIFLLRKTA